MLQANVNLKAISEARHDDGREEGASEKDDELELPGEAKSAMKDMCEMNDNANSDLTLE